MFKKGLLTLSAGIMLSAFSVAPASAGTLESTYSGSFSKDWELYSASSDNKATITYGYNTSWINEDYVWANHSTKDHYGALYNGAWHAAPSKSATELSKIEVRHDAASTNKYQCNW
ncbi:hypothetical protein [Lysinibacillus sp. Y5S-8]|uniref:mediterrocin family bacteriocin n=1 Tax=Lysinibacillus sp. Y5S-8 TaxID=3122488 RepID=UPI00115102A4